MKYRIGPYVYDAELVSGLLENNGQLCLGLAKFSEQKLQVSDEQHPQQQVHVLAHEISEAIAHHFHPDFRDTEVVHDHAGNVTAVLFAALFRSPPIERLFRNGSLKSNVQPVQKTELRYVAIGLISVRD